MALHENGEKQESGSNPSTPEKKRQCWVVLVLRVLALCATVSATVVMTLNKETKTIVLATIGTTPIKATLNAKFQYTKAFVFFVIAYGIGSIHNLLVLVATLFPHKFDFKGLRLLLITITDMMTVALLAAAAGAATSMAELGMNGNKHAGWSKICDRFDTFCDHGSGALTASFVAVILLMILNVLSIIILSRKPAFQAIVP